MTSLAHTPFGFCVIVRSLVDAEYVRCVSLDRAVLSIGAALGALNGAETDVPFCVKTGILVAAAIDGMDVYTCCFLGDGANAGELHTFHFLFLIEEMLGLKYAHENKNINND